MVRSKFLRDGTSSFANDLKVMNNPRLDKLIIVECFAPCFCVFKDARYCFLNVA